MFISLRVNQLDAYSQVVRDLSYGALDDAADAQILCNLIDALARGLVTHDGCPGDDLQLSDFGKSGNQFLSHPVDEILIPWIWADVGKGAGRRSFFCRVSLAG